MAREYESQAVRDLVWALTTPSMVEHPLAVTASDGEADLARYPGILGRFDRDDSELHQAIRERNSGRLGEYFEILITTWLAALPPVSLIAANEQVKGGGGTVGEFDLVFARDDAFHHWELAIKFYLGHPGRNGESLWFGPNPIDRLDRKWPKMKDQQLMLGRNRHGRRHLERLGVPDESPVHPAAFLKGYLYESLDERFRVERMQESNPDVPSGWWVHRGDLERYRDELECGEPMKWLTLPRFQWMSSARESSRNRAQKFESFEQSLRESRPTHVVGLVDGIEMTRGFIVPDRWPTR